MPTRCSADGSDAVCAGPTRRGRTGRAIWLALGIILVGVAFVGIFVPLLPTTDFLILALPCFARSSPRLEAWLLNHPRFGPSLRAWQAERAIPSHAKWAAYAGMLLGYGLFWLAVRPGPLLGMLVILMLTACAAWIFRRPEPVASDRHGHDAVPVAADHRLTPAGGPVYAGTRYSDRPRDWRSRVFGVSGTVLVLLLVAAIGLFTWQVSYTVTPPSEPFVVEMEPQAAPPEPPEEVPDGPRQVEQKPRHTKRKQVDPPMPPVPAPTTPVAVEQPRDVSAQPGVTQAVPQTTAPRSLPAPPATHLSSEAERTWEALLLAHLEKYRRYPAAARARGEQGAVYVRFHMNRSGQVLSSEIVRSSGSALLDKAALDTLRRAQPLPRIPDDRPDEVDLSIPIEFFVDDRGSS